MDEEEMDVEALLDRAYESEDAEEVEALVARALEIEPDNPEALLLRADLTDDDEERLSILQGALEAVEAVLKEEGVEEEAYEENPLGTVYLALMQRAAFTLYGVGDDERAMELIERLLRHDLDDNGAVRSLHYRILIEQNAWQLILSKTMQDEDHQLGWAYARLCAAFMLAPKGAERGTAARMFWEALTMSPNVPFYMLGYLAEPADDSETEEEDFNFASLYADVWSTSRDLLNWFSRGVILFGLLSGRFGEESGDMLEILTSLGGRQEYEAMCKLPMEGDDVAVIETLAAHHCLAGQ